MISFLSGPARCAFYYTIWRSPFSAFFFSSKNLKLKHWPWLNDKRIKKRHCIKIKEQTPLQHDIALLHLKNPLILTENVSAIAVADSTPQPGSTVRASGMHVHRAHLILSASSSRATCTCDRDMFILVYY